jgi:decaprenylphospho-beta-D-ribofuranose 2-oxidase
MSHGGETELLSGWGRSSPSRARVVRPSSSVEVEKLVAELAGSGEPLLARGLGRSYGDAAQCGGGTVFDCRGLTETLQISSEGLCRASAGVSVADLLSVSVPAGWFIPVTPGTRQVTLGGAVASDVHGKNHHVDGSFSAHLSSLELVTPAGRLTCGPTEAAGAFNATCGGMGLTGVVTELTFQLFSIESSLLRVDTERASDLEACLAILAERPEDYRYSVAWVDGLSSGRNLGRAVITRGNHARAEELPTKAKAEPLSYRPSERLKVPFMPPVTPLSRPSIKVLNELWFQRAPRQRRTTFESIASFFHPLDAVRDWNLAYGPHGFTQYQFVVPFGAESVLRQTFERLAQAGQPPFLVVLKSFGKEAAGHISFPRQGWTLALDLPLGRPGLGEVLDGLDELVAGAGGRVYLSKDSRLTPELIETMYPHLPEWRQELESLDPGGAFTSDLSRRLGLRDGTKTRTRS